MSFINERGKMTNAESLKRRIDSLQKKLEAEINKEPALPPLEFPYSVTVETSATFMNLKKIEDNGSGSRIGIRLWFSNQLFANFGTLSVYALGRSLPKSMRRKVRVTVTIEDLGYDESNPFAI